MTLQLLQDSTDGVPADELAPEQALELRHKSVHLGMQMVGFRTKHLDEIITNLSAMAFGIGAKTLKPEGVRTLAATIFMYAKKLRAARRAEQGRLPAVAPSNFAGQQLVSLWARVLGIFQRIVIEQSLYSLGHT